MGKGSEDRQDRRRDPDGRFVCRWSGMDRTNVEDLPQLPVSAGVLALAVPGDGVLAVWPDRADETVAIAIRKLIKAGPAAVLITDDTMSVTIKLETLPAPQGGSVPYWRCPSCGVRRRHLYVTPPIRCRGCTLPRLRFRSEGRPPCRLPAALLAGKPAGELGARDMVTVIRLAAQAEREVWLPTLIADPTRAVALFSNAGWTEAG